MRGRTLGFESRISYHDGEADEANVTTDGPSADEERTRGRGHTLVEPWMIGWS